MRNRTRIALGLVLILLGSVLLAERVGWLVGREAPVWTLVTGCVGVVFLVLAASGRRSWWAFIPACIFLAVAGLTYVSAHRLLPEDVATGGFLFFGVALPFWLIFLARRRSAGWAAIPASVLTFVALGVGIGPVAGERWSGALVIWSIAAPFWVVYLTNRQHWWAIIPAGAMTTIGVTPLVAETWPGQMVAALIFGGMAATFLLIYLLSGLRRDMAWALWPAAGCLLAAVAVPLLGQWSNLLWPALLIVGGIVLLLLSFIRPER